MPALDATLGGSTANSYQTVAEADSYFAGTLRESEWVALTPETKSAALVAAAAWLDTLNYGGKKCHPSSDDDSLPQSMKWPRSGITCDRVKAACTFIPKQIIVSQASLALQLGINPDVLTGPPGSTFDARKVTRERVDVLEQEYTDVPDALQWRRVRMPWLLQQYPWLADYLGCWLDLTSGRLVRLCRN